MVEGLFFLSPFPFPISYIALYYYCFILVTMDASMEELWKHFKLSEKEKGITTVEASVVAISKQ